VSIQEVFQYAKEYGLPIVILVFVLLIILKFYDQERAERRKTQGQLNDLYHRLEERLYHELDELEKILREERSKL